MAAISPAADTPTSETPLSALSASPILTPTPGTNEDTFYAGALKRTGTLVSGAKEGMLKRSGTVSEAVNGGLKRTGTIIGDARDGLAQRSASVYQAAGQGWEQISLVTEGYKQGILKRSGTVGQDARAGLQRTGTVLASASSGAIERAGTFSEWARDYAKGIYDAERPLKATFQEIPGVQLSKTGHSISTINGRLYIFGGENEDGELASNDMHVVFLPSSGVLSADYKSIGARSDKGKDGPVPAARTGHNAVVTGDEIYIFGGRLSGKAKEEEAGRVWIFDTISSRWSFLDPKADAPYPPPRSNCAATIADDGLLQSYATGLHVTDSETVAPLIASGSPGVIFIYGGVSPSEDEQMLNDVWAFDIGSQQWLPLPPPPAPARPGASLALSGSKLYRAGGKTSPEHVLEIDHLDVEELLKVCYSGGAHASLALPNLLREWTPATLSAPLLGPFIRSVKPDNGGTVLLSIQSGAKTVTAIDVSPGGGGLAYLSGTQDEGSDDLKAPKQVQAVQVQYADYYGEVIRGALHHGVTSASGFALEAGSTVDEANLIIWGGKAADGKVVGNGWMVRIGL